MALQRRYSSVGPAVSHRRLLHADFDCVKLIESEVLHHAGAPDKRQQVWYKFEFKMHEVCFILNVIRCFLVVSILS